MLWWRSQRQKSRITEVRIKTDLWHSFPFHEQFRAKELIDRQCWGIRVTGHSLNIVSLDNQPFNSPGYLANCKVWTLEDLEIFHRKLVWSRWTGGKARLGLWRQMLVWTRIVKVRVARARAFRWFQVWVLARRSHHQNPSFPGQKAVFTKVT